MLGLPGSLQDDRLVRVGAPGGGRWGPGLGYDKQKLLHGVFQGLCTLSCCLDGCSDAIAEVHVSAWLGCNEVDLGDWVFHGDSLHQMCIHSYNQLSIRQANQQ